MQLSISGDGEMRVVYLEGELDGQSAPAVQDELLGLVNQGTCRILLNFQKLNFISSAGLRVLLITAKELTHKQGEVRVCCASDSVLEVFEISGFNTIITVHPDEKAALQGF